MSRIFFLAANTTLEPYPVYPLGMGVVTSALMNAGHEVKQFDFLAQGKSTDLLTSEMAAFSPDFICISMRNIDNVDSFTSDTEWYLDEVRALIRLLRSSCKTPIICGRPRLLHHARPDT